MDANATIRFIGLVFVCLSPNALSAYSITMPRACLNEGGTVGHYSTRKPAMKVAGFAPFQTPGDLVRARYRGTGTDQMSEVLLLGSHKPLPADISAGNWGGKQRGCGLPWKEDVRGSQAYIIYSLALEDQWQTVHAKG